MKNLQNNNLKFDWPMVASLEEDAYLCTNLTKEMNEVTSLNKPDNENLKPYSMEEIYAMIEESERDFEAGRVYTTEEVLDYCKKGLAQLKKP